MECPICMENFSASEESHLPKLLHCGHSICAGCFVVLPAKPVRDGFNNVECPTCRHMTLIDVKKGCPTNFALKELLESALKQRLDDDDDDGKEVQKVCEECGNSAEVFCENCSASFCQACREGTHASKVMSKHASVPIKEKTKAGKKKGTGKCAQHGERNVLFCLDCTNLICILCRDYGSHKGHKVDLVST
jgi:hypothetical protein